MKNTYTQSIASWRLIVLILMALIALPVNAQNRPESQKPPASNTPTQLPTDFFDAQSKNSSEITDAKDVRNYLNQLQENNRLSETDTDYVVTSEHTSKLSGIRHIYYRQAINGIGVQGTESSLHLKNDGTVFRSHDHNLIKDLSGVVRSNTSGLSAQQAIEAVASQMNYGTLNNLKEITPSKKVSATEKLFTGAGISNIDIPIKQQYYLVPDDGIHMVWEMSIQETTGSDWWNFIVDANTGAIINKHNFTVYCNLTGNHDSHDHDSEIVDESYDVPFEEETKTSEAEDAAFAGSYLVYALPLENPYYGARTIETDPEDVTASPFGWHDTNGVAGAEFTITRGNNTYTYDDIGNNNAPGFSPNGGAGLSFNFGFNATQSQGGISGLPRFLTSARSLNAAITNTFYWTNIVHDITYHYGFDEASGNFQENNYGNGGIGGDSVNGEAQDGDGTCNANFGTPGDGGNPRMQMFVCNTFDGDYDNVVIVHEYAHGISNRLVGGAGDPLALTNTEQMGEGWSDFYSYMYTMDATNFSNSRTVGTFLFGQGVNGPGIRAAPYSSNMAVNNFRHANVTTTGVSPHALGHIWATILYDMVQALINDQGFDPDLYTGTGGNNIALALVTEGLKFTPVNPGFVDGRDAILAADQALYGSAYECIIWEAFAARGLGFSASQGSTASRTDNTNAFDVPPITFAATDNTLCTASGSVTIGGGAVSGGTYSGPGVTDDGNGSTFTFDPLMAGIGPHTITYTAMDCNGVMDTDTDMITVTEILPDISACPDVTLALGADGTVTYDPFGGGENVNMVGGNNNSGTQGFTIFFVSGAIITQTTTVSFDWEQITADGDLPAFDSFGYLLGNTLFPISPNGASVENGTFSIEVPAGQNFGFFIGTMDNNFGAATATVSNFSPGYSGQFATGNWQVFNQNANGTASFSGIPDPLLVSCGDITTSLSQSVFTCLDIGTTTSVTVTVTDSLGNMDTCATDVTITGGLSTTTFASGAWNNGTPTGNSMAIVNGDYDTASLGDLNACSCQINSGQTVTVRDGNFMNISGNIVVDGTLVVENTGSVVQIDAGAVTTNNGTIQVNKTTSSLDPRDFIILSSPMSTETRAGVYGSANRSFLIDPTEFEPDTSTIGSGTGVTFLDTDGSYFSPATSLNVGEGYLVFPQAVNAVGAVNYAHTYTQGTLNSGTISKPLVYNGPATANNFNLIGNPYASAIDITALISQNASINAIYFWEHITAPNENLPGFNNANFSMDDVSLRNLLGGIASANGGTAPGQYMASGQGFGVLANQTESGSSTPIVFTNAMRVTGNNGTPRSAETTVDKLWLGMKSEDFTSNSSTLIGFTDGATPGLDLGYDSGRLSTTFSLFSTLDDAIQLGIQGREAFDNSMEIDLGFETILPESRSYTISVDQWEGINLDESQIFLIDNELGTVTNLKESEYTFTASESIQPNRFKVVFDERALGTDDPLSLENQIRLFPSPARNSITMTYTGGERLTQAVIVDINGKLITTIDLGDFEQSRSINISNFSSGIYFMRVQSTQSLVVKRFIVQ